MEMYAVNNKRKLEREKRIILTFVLIMLLSFAAMTSSALAITFELGNIGTVGYAGGATPLTTVNGSVVSVDGTPISFGVLTYTTGNLVLGSSNTLFFAGNGSLKITGDIGFGGVTLLAGDFASTSTLTFNSNSNSASWTAPLNVTAINSSLADILNITGGTITQIQMSLSLINQGDLTSGFTGTQNSGTVDITATAVPEPSSLFLLGSGLLGLGLIRWKKGE